MSDSNNIWEWDDDIFDSGLKSISFHLADEGYLPISWGCLARFLSGLRQSEEGTL